MDLNDFFRGFFGIPRRNYGNNFRDYEENDEDFPEDERFGPSDFTANFFEIFTNPLEIHKYFEQQMDEMLKNLQVIAPQPREFEPAAESENLRLKMFKPGLEPKNNYGGYEESQKKQDEDLDEQIASGGLQKLFPKREDSLNYNSQSSWTFSQGMNAVINQKKVSIDASGCRKEVMTQQAGDKKYIVEKRKCPGEAEEIVERFFNMTKDEAEQLFKKNERPEMRLPAAPRQDEDLFDKYFRQ